MCLDCIYYVGSCWVLFVLSCFFFFFLGGGECCLVDLLDLLMWGPYLVMTHDMLLKGKDGH